MPIEYVHCKISFFLQKKNEVAVSELKEIS